MRLVFESLKSVVRTGGDVFVVIGNNKTTAGGQEIEVESTTALIELGASVGWALEDVIGISVTKEALVHARNSISENAVLWFKAS